mmetsp:Transcript_26106/g.52071  ORF Transcript_26106/g.52071 Transcript_26106/m.52071 type:complete len:517 (+) Transcript_26106:227-1777(+)
MLPPSISTKAFGPDDSSLISDDSVGDVNVAKYVTHVETGAGTLSPFFISQTGERVPYGGQGSPRVAFLAVSDTQPELGASGRALKGSYGYESVHTNVNSSVPDSFPSIASKLKQASKQLKDSSSSHGYTGPIAPAPVSAPPSLYATPTSSPPHRPAPDAAVPPLDLGAGALGGAHLDEPSPELVSQGPLKKRGKVQPHRRSSSFNSKTSRSPQLASIETLAKARSITGSTQFTKPAQGALRMNKFVQRLHSALVSEVGRDTVTWRKGCLVLHSVEDFTKDTLPLYFKTSNFKTFRRQLNYYGFVHARSVQNGPKTTALWVNQELASAGCSDIDAILLLKRVDASDDAKTVDGRRQRKEGAVQSLAATGDPLTDLGLEVKSDKGFGSSSTARTASRAAPTGSVASRQSTRTKSRARVVSQDSPSLTSSFVVVGGGGSRSAPGSRSSTPPTPPKPAFAPLSSHPLYSALTAKKATLQRSHTPETEVLARMLMNLGGNTGGGRASPRGGGSYGSAFIVT